MVGGGQNERGDGPSKLAYFYPILLYPPSFPSQSKRALRALCSTTGNLSVQKQKNLTLDFCF